MKGQTQKVQQAVLEVDMIHYHFFIPIHVWFLIEQNDRNSVLVDLT